MNKTLAILAALCVLFTCTAVLAEPAVLTEEMAALVGSWDMYSEDTLAGSIVLKDDGTYESYVEGQQVSAGVWTAENGIFNDGEMVAAYTLEDGVLTLQPEGYDVKVTLRRALDNNLVGTWKVENLADLLGEMAASITETITFYADGTVTVTAEAMGNTNTQSYTWQTANGVLTMNGGDATYTIEDNVLTMDQDGIVMVLSRVEE